MKSSTERMCSDARRVFAALGHCVGRFSRRDFDAAYVGWCSLCHRPGFVSRSGRPFGKALTARCPGKPGADGGCEI